MTKRSLLPWLNTALPSASLISPFVKRFIKTGALMVALFLSGCAAVSTPTSTEWESHRLQLEQIESFTTKGRLAYRSPEQRLSSTLYWVQTPEETTIRLINVIGKTLLAVEKTDQRTIVTDMDGHRHVGHDINRMTYQLTGLMLPIEELQDWILGLPSGADQYTLNEQQRLAALTLNAQGQVWRMEVNSYNYALTPALPSKLTLENDDQRIIVLLNQWELK